jgi:alpha-tubulin suppressor-like RCC1 family protein
MSNYNSDTIDFDRIYMTSNSLFNMYLSNTTNTAINALYMAGTNSVPTYVELPNSITILAGTTVMASPILTDSKYGWKQVLIGNGSGAGVRYDGTLAAWGQYANGSIDSANTVVPVNGSTGSTWSAVIRGDDFGLAIKSDGTLWGWGNGGSGQLGDGASSWRSSLVQVSGGSTWSKIASSRYGATVLAIKTDGTLWAWGKNGSGQAGIGSAGLGAAAPTLVFSAVGQTAGKTVNQWAEISTSYLHSLAISSDSTTSGYVYSWGNNTYGQLGSLTSTGSAISSRTTPTLVGTSVPAGYTPYISGATAVAAGYATSAAIAGGVLWTWGQNPGGQLGDGTTTTRSSPVTVAGGGTTWKKVTFGPFDQFASTGLSNGLKTDGSMWYWGANYYGQAGTGTSQTFTSSPQSMTNWSGNTWFDISGGGYTFAAIKQYQ